MALWLTQNSRYNLQAHPLPFMKSVTAVAPKKSTREKPDLEEAMEDSDQAELSDDVKQEDDEDAAAGLSKDKYLRQPRKRATQSKGGGQKAKKQPSGTDKHTLELDAGDEVDGKGKKSRKGKAAKATAGR